MNNSVRRHKQWRLGLSLAVILFFSLVPAWAAGVPMKVKKPDVSKTADKLEIPADLTPDKVDTYLAGLTDGQVRQVLAEKLKDETAAHRPGGDAQTRKQGAIVTLFQRMEKSGMDFLAQMSSIYNGFSDRSVTGAAVVKKLSGGKGAGHLALVLMGLVLLVFAGIACERLFLHLTRGLRRQLVDNIPRGWRQKLGQTLSRILIDALGVACFILVTFGLYILFYTRTPADRIITSNLLISAYYYRIIILAARILLAPAAANLRLAPMADSDAAFLFGWIRIITGFAAIATPISTIFQAAGFSRQIWLSAYCGVGLGITLLLAAMIWQARQRVAQVIFPDTVAGAGKDLSLRARLARTWHWLAIFYILLIGFFWQVSVAHGQVTVVKLIISIFLIPAFIALDQWGQRLLKIAAGETSEIIDLSGEPAPSQEEISPLEAPPIMKDYVPLIKRAFRIVLLIFLFFIVLQLWGINFSIGRIFTGHLLNIVGTLLLGFIIWQFAKARIDKKLKEEMPDDDEEMEEGGAGGSRIGTLLLLLRKFVIVVLFVIVSLIVLSSLGIDIGPLIAGAGVVGLAIGFGAQTLVKDIIAGVFFLIDDAFRVGDYVSAGGAKGMVEQISLRSVKLRHPRGPVYTIPFGSLGSVQNMSRDYIITKLDFRVKYDTDVDKVRKLIKKINKKLSKDPEISKVLLGKVKSQGIRELDDSAMIMRVKFKTLPGEQFVIRRLVFQMLKDAFEQNHIEFAHRNVTVYLPPEENQKASGSQDSAAPEDAASGTDHDKVVKAAAGAAAAAVIQAEEAAKAEAAKKGG